MFGLNPWLILGTVLFTIVVGAAGYLKGHSVGTTEGDVKIATLRAEAVEAKQKQQQAELIQASNASTGFQNDTAKARIVYRTLHDLAAPIVSRPIYLNGCFDDDGLRIANAALTGQSAAPNTAGPNTAMPRSLATP